MRSTSALAAATSAVRSARRLVAGAPKILGRAQRGVERTARGVLEAHRHEQAAPGGSSQPQREAIVGGNVAAQSAAAPRAVRRTRPRARRSPARCAATSRSPRRASSRAHPTMRATNTRGRSRPPPVAATRSVRPLASRPGNGTAPVCFNRADDPPPERRGRVIGSRQRNPAIPRPHQPGEPIQPPCGHRLGDLGPLQPGIGDIQATRRPPRAGWRAASRPARTTAPRAGDRGIDRDLIDGKVEPDPQPMLRGLAARCARCRHRQRRASPAPGAAPRDRRWRRCRRSRPAGRAARHRSCRTPWRGSARNAPANRTDRRQPADGGGRSLVPCRAWFRLLGGPRLRPWNASE